MRGWVLSSTAACLVHGAVILMPVVSEQLPVPKHPEPEVVLRLVPASLKPAVAPVPPAPTKPPPVVRKKKRVRRPKPTPKSLPPVPTKPIPKSAPDPATVREAPPSVPPPAEDRTPQPAPVDLRPYGRGIHHAIMSHRRYPHVARRLRLEGRAFIRITLKQNGHLATEPRVHRSSGHTLLDKEALRMVRAAAPFDHLPSGFSKSTVSIVIPVEFVLRT